MIDATEVLTRLIQESPPVRVDAIGEARLPGQAWKTSHFFITRDHALVYIDEDGHPKLAAFAEIVGYDDPKPVTIEDGRIEGPAVPHYVVRTSEGETWELLPTGRCACGSSIGLAFNPFPIRKRGT